MRRFVESNPEKVHVASDYKEVGKSFDLNRQRVTNVVSSISRSNNNAMSQRISSLIEGDGITDAEKPSLARERDSLIRDFDYLGNDTRNADLGDSDEYRAVKDAYDLLIALMDKIINSEGTYTNSDLNNLTAYYADYTAKSIVLQNLILEVTSEQDRISAYYAQTKIVVKAYPEAVPVNTNTDVSVSVLYGSEEVDITDISEDCFSFGITGLASGATSSMFVFDYTLYPNAYVQITPLTNSAVVSRCKAFGLAYGAIGNSGVVINCSLTLDSETIPF